MTVAFYDLEGRDLKRCYQIINEPKSRQRKLIKLIIEVLGEEETAALLQQSLDLEAGDGMMTKDKRRRRTPGGVFFYLAHGAIAAKGLS